jgi:hypothetical protein
MCPKCKQGRLTIIEDSLKTEEPSYSSNARAHDAWEADWITERFSVRLQCGLPKCGEIVCILGDTVTEELLDDEVGWTYGSVLRPRAMFPAPPIMVLPNDTPSLVEEAIESSFALFWMDLGASASRLRTSVERLMDHYRIVKTRIAKNRKKPKAAGKRVPYDLSVRIDKFVAAIKPSVPAKTLHALRLVGNLGTHGSKLTRDALLDAYTVYEDALDELIGKRREKIAGLVRKITKTKGRY